MAQTSKNNTIIAHLINQKLIALLSDSEELPTGSKEKLPQVDGGVISLPHQSTGDISKQNLDERFKNFSPGERTFQFNLHMKG